MRAFYSGSSRRNISSSSSSSNRSGGIGSEGSKGSSNGGGGGGVYVEEGVEEATPRKFPVRDPVLSKILREGLAAEVLAHREP